MKTIEAVATTNTQSAQSQREDEFTHIKQESNPEKDLPLHKANEWLVKTEAREFQADIETSTGFFYTGLGLLGSIIKIPIVGSFASGLLRITEGVTHRKEAVAIREASDPKSKKEEVEEKIKTAKVFSVLQNLPALGGLLSVLESSPQNILAAAGDIVMSVFKIQQVEAIRKHLQAHYEFKEKGPQAKITSREWLQKQENRQIPYTYSKLEKIWQYVKIGVYSITSLTALVYGLPVVTGLGALSIWYSAWKIRKVIPEMQRYYKLLDLNTEYILNQTSQQAREQASVQVRSQQTVQPRQNSQPQQKAGNTRMQAQQQQEAIVVEGIPDQPTPAKRKIVEHPAKDQIISIPPSLSAQRQRIDTGTEAIPIARDIRIEDAQLLIDMRRGFDIGMQVKYDNLRMQFEMLDSFTRKAEKEISEGKPFAMKMFVDGFKYTDKLRSTSNFRKVLTEFVDGIKQNLQAGKISQQQVNALVRQIHPKIANSPFINEHASLLDGLYVPEEPKPVTTKPSKPVYIPPKPNVTFVSGVPVDPGIKPIYPTRKPTILRKPQAEYDKKIWGEGVAEKLIPKDNPANKTFWERIDGLKWESGYALIEEDFDNLDTETQFMNDPNIMLGGLTPEMRQSWENILEQDIQKVRDSIQKRLVGEAHNLATHTISQAQYEAHLKQLKDLAMSSQYAKRFADIF